MGIFQKNSNIKIHKYLEVKMGKGDRKSKRGKINRGTYGKRRPHKVKTKTEVKEEKTEKNK